MLILLTFAFVLGTSVSFNFNGTDFKSYRELNLEGRIVNGEDAAVGQFPHHVGLKFITNTGYDWCSGSLIHLNWVLTAAHCANKAKSVVVFLGTANFADSEIYYKLPKSNIIVHPQFNNKLNLNDIALLMIPKVKVSAYINVVRLPTLATSYPSYENEVVIASGWGLQSDNDVDFSSTLKYGRMVVISNEKCAETFGSAIVSSHICASSEARVSTCEGDSGSPLISEKDGTLIGLAAFHVNQNCESGYPAAFTRVTSFLSWIQIHTNLI